NYYALEDAAQDARTGWIHGELGRPGARAGAGRTGRSVEIRGENLASLELDGTRSEYFVTRLGHQDGVFELCGQAPVRGHGRPAVVQDLAVGGAAVDHGLDGEDHAGAHARPASPLSVVGHLRLGVERAADAMAHEIPDHRRLPRLGEL